MLSLGLTKEHLHSSSFSSWLSLQKILSPLPQTAPQVCTDWSKWDRGPFHCLWLVAAWLLVLDFFFFLIYFFFFFLLQRVAFCTVVTYCRPSALSVQTQVFSFPLSYLLSPFTIPMYPSAQLVFFPLSLFPNPWGHSWNFGESLLKVWDTISMVLSYKQIEPSLLFTLIMRVCVCVCARAPGCLCEKTSYRPPCRRHNCVLFCLEPMGRSLKSSLSCATNTWATALSQQQDVFPERKRGWEEGPNVALFLLLSFLFRLSRCCRCVQKCLLLIFFLLHFKVFKF